METVSKRSSSGTQTTMISLMPRDQNAAARTKTHTTTHAAMTFPTNTTGRHASAERRDLNMNQPSRKEWGVQKQIVFTTPASDGVGGLIKS